MNNIIDNVVLLVLAAALIFREQNMTEPVLALLIGIIVAAFGIYFSERKKFLPVCILFVVFCCFLPELLFFLPIVFYHNVKYHSYWDGMWGISFLLTYASYEPWELASAVMLCGLGILLAVRSGKIETLEYEMIRMRDTSTELHLALKEKNKNLMEKQDYEIYLATLRERNRIAREIHDNVGHMLSRSILQVGALGTVHKEEPLHGQLGSINDTLNQAMNSIRESVHDLHDDSVDLKQAVLEATRDMQEKYQIRIDYDMTRAVSRNVKYCFIATVKEAMSNIVKHSNADKIEIILREHPGFYQLSIEDNGTKIPVSSGDGIGLSNMRERVEALNGTLRIQTEQGFKIFISIKREAGGVSMKVVVVDDDQLVAISLKTILEADAAIEVTATGYNGKEAITLYEEHKPEVLLMDIRMEVMNGLEAAEHIIAKYPEARILFLTTFSDDEYIVKALGIGVKGYILKQDFEGIVPAIKAVYGGQSVFGGEIVGKLPVLMQPKEEFDYSQYDISEKEQSIIELVAEGLSNKEIAEALFLSEGTVRNYISTVLEKLALRDRTQLAVFYYKNM